jgi:hypothetical protein
MQIGNGLEAKFWDDRWLDGQFFFFSANARSSGYSLRRGKMIPFIGKPDRKTVSELALQLFACISKRR